MDHRTRLLATVFCCGFIAAVGSTADSSEFCSVDQKNGNCGEKAEHTTSFMSTLATRYLLYEVNAPEGFNLRRDVYMRLAIFMRNLSQKEGNWKLVLPPWGQLYHWQSSNMGKQTKFPWRMFFDIPSLQRFTPVIEMEEFLKTKRKGKPAIDEVYVLQHYKDMWDEGKDWQDRWGVERCTASIPYTKAGMVIKGPFWGYDNITAQKVVCASFQGRASLLTDLLNSTNARSVMIDRAEVALHDYYGDSIYWQARRSMRFAQNLVKIAEKFLRENLHFSNEEYNVHRPADWQDESEKQISKGGPYLAVHLRRKDFLYGRAREVPDLQFAATQLEEILKKLKLDTIFVATDAPKPEIAELKTHLSKYKILRFEPSSTLKYEIKDGGIAIVDQIICSHGQYFIGTYESTFSFRIQEEREIMGFPANTTFNRLCGRQEGHSCPQPTQWRVIF